VVIQEDVHAEGERIRLLEAARTGRHIRRAGQDFQAGEAVLAAGRRLNSRDIGLAAAANHPWLIVHRRPRVAILATGDEIALPGEPIPPGGIVSSNAHALAALVCAGGGEPVVLPIAGDDPALIAGVVEASAGMDLLLTTGGASVGAHDLVQAALVARGMTLDFWKIAMRPGKPLIFGRLGTTPVLGLPGNPVSAMVCAILYLLPALARLGGETREVPASEPAWLGEALRANDHRADFLRARLHRDTDGRLIATAFEQQDSSLLSVLAAAEALILRPPHAEASAAGAPVDIIRLDLLGV
jgi:molybdopterin molybdotransferase